MKILYFSNSTSIQGGAELNLYKIYNHFAEHNDSYIVLPDSEGIYEFYKKNGYTPIVIRAKRPSFNSGLVNFIKFFINLPVLIIKIRKIILEHNIEIVHTNDIIDFPAMVAAKLTNAKLVSHLRFIIKKDGFQKKIFRRIYLFCADQIICVSNAVRNNWFPNSEKAVVIYNGGPDLNTFNKVNKKQISDGTFRIVTVGKLVNISGHENIIRAIIGIKNRIDKDINLDIVGGSVEGHEAYERMLHKLVEENELSKNVIFTGYTDKVYEHLSSADLFVFTPTWEHAFPTVVLEAMAMDLPIIAFPKGGICEQVEDGENGFLVDTIEELEERIVELIQNENLVDTLSKNSSLILKQKFNLRKHFTEIDAVYKKLNKES